MTHDQTRQLGIEFERRVQTMIPEKEYLDKLDTETIYSFLNQAQDRYIHDVYRSLDKVMPNSNDAKHIERVLQPYLKSIILGNEDKTPEYGGSENFFESGKNAIKYNLPQDYYLYGRSVSKVDSTFNWKGSTTAFKVIPNVWTNQVEVGNFIETPYDQLRIIRYPLAIISEYEKKKNSSEYGQDEEPIIGTLYRDAVDSQKKAWGGDENVTPTLTIIHDRYTNILDVQLMYYSTPTYFTPLDNTTTCKLPMDCFEELLTLALDLYVQYVAGAEANKKAKQEQMRKQQEAEQKAQERQNRRNSED